MRNKSFLHFRLVLTVFIISVLSASCANQNADDSHASSPDQMSVKKLDTDSSSQMPVGVITDSSAKMPNPYDTVPK